MTKIEIMTALAAAHIASRDNKNQRMTGGLGAFLTYAGMANGHPVHKINDHFIEDIKAVAEQIMMIGGDD